MSRGPAVLPLAAAHLERRNRDSLTRFELERNLKSSSSTPAVPADSVLVAAFAALERALRAFFFPFFSRRDLAMSDSSWDTSFTPKS